MMPRCERREDMARVAKMRTALAARVWVLALFAVAPLLPGYRGVRVPLAALFVALFPS